MNFPCLPELSPSEIIFRKVLVGSITVIKRRSQKMPHKATGQGTPDAWR
jgi:hypothetical protein